MLSYLVRSFKQLNRYRLRSLTTIIGLTTMVVVITFLLNFTIQMDSLFQQTNLDFFKKYQYLSIGSYGNYVPQSSFAEIESIDGVESILPVTQRITMYPWINNESIEGYHVLPFFIKYYDPDYAKDFFKGDLMVDVSEGTGVIISSDFRKNMMTAEQYENSFGGDQELKINSDRLVSDYQKRDFPMSEEIVEVPLVGKELRLEIDDEYDDSVKKEIVSLEIIGEIKSEYIYLNKTTVFFPFKVKTDQRKQAIKYDGLLLKTKSLADVPRVVEELDSKGYDPINSLKYLEDYFNRQKIFLYNILIVMGIILLLAIFSFSNTMQSIIQERRAEIALKKALGATSGQIVLGIVLEGLLIAIISLIVGFLLVIGLIKGISLMVSTDFINPAYYEAFKLDKESTLFLLSIPYSIYGYISLATLFLGFSISYIPARRFFQQNYLTLIRRD